VGYVKTQLSCVLFIMLTTTCFGHCGPSLGHRNVCLLHGAESFLRS